MATVDIRNCHKFFDRVEVLHDVSIAIGDGEFVVLVGPSGCGKSTLLRMVAGLEEVSLGEVLIDGALMNGVAPKDRNVAMVFQNYALYPHKTVAENMGFSLKLAKRPKAEIERRVREAAAILDLEPYLDRHPKQLSGGQRQRVAMGRAIVRDPKVFLFDEPLSNLDAKLRVQMRAEVKSLHRRLGTTAIYVTHDQVEAMTMADRIVVMRDGLVEQIGTPRELYEAPGNVFVAGFIGSPAMNFIRGRVRLDAGRPVLEAADIRLPLPGSGSLADGREVLFGVRPRHFSICGPEDPAACRLDVEVVEPTGDETEISGRMAGVWISVAFPGEPRVRPGEELHVAPLLDRSHLFDAETTQRISSQERP